MQAMRGRVIVKRRSATLTPATGVRCLWTGKSKARYDQQPPSTDRRLRPALETGLQTLIGRKPHLSVGICARDQRQRFPSLWSRGAKIGRPPALRFTTAGLGLSANPWD